MPDATATANVQVVNPHGMHLRPADLFARTAMRFSSKVCVTFDGQQVDGRSIVELLMLAARQGSQVSIAVTGEDAEEALSALVKLVEDGFGEMEEAEGKNDKMTNDQ
jgi:phosphocarrier protein